MSIFDLLQAEFVLQPDAPLLPRALRDNYLIVLGRARDKEHLPRQVNVAYLDSLRGVLSKNATLRELATQAIATRKIVYAEVSLLPTRRCFHCLR